MITVKKEIQLPDTYPLSRLGPAEDLLFFDIETTGFSGEYSQLYLIGCTCLRGQSWRLTQWFADRSDAEKDILSAFFSFLSQFSTVVHFNGDGFDIPYLQKRCQAHQLACSFSETTSIDIYKKIRPYRNLLALESMKQKSVERFLGIHREDRFSGGELIAVYQEYLKTKSDQLYDMLMLHNREDLEGMPLILPILYYPDFFEGDFTFREQTICEDEPSAPRLILTAAGSCALPVPIAWDVSFQGRPLHVQITGSELTASIPLYAGTLKYFYPDSQNYYYLPYEDRAIHKSVGEYVEKSARRKATPQTCYTRKESLYLPQPSPIWVPAFREDYKAKNTYAEYSPGLLRDPKALNAYIRALFR